jgi:hypothetical protein
MSSSIFEIENEIDDEDSTSSFSCQEQLQDFYGFAQNGISYDKIIDEFKRL